MEQQLPVKKKTPLPEKRFGLQSKKRPPIKLKNQHGGTKVALTYPSTFSSQP